MAALSINELAEKYAKHNMGSIFLYTNEAHPGEHYPHLTSMDMKFNHAEELKEFYGVSRPILVDSLDGACHRAYGSMPNMSWIFNRSGVPVYKSNWTDVTSLDLTFDYLLNIKTRRREGKRLAPFLVERLDFRVQDQDRFYKGLAKNGPKAVTEFDSAF